MVSDAGVRVQRREVRNTHLGRNMARREIVEMFASQLFDLFSDAVGCRAGESQDVSVVLTKSLIDLLKIGRQLQVKLAEALTLI